MAFGHGQASMVWTFPRSTTTPSFDIMCPRSSSFPKPNEHFFKLCRAAVSRALRRSQSSVVGDHSCFCCRSKYRQKKQAQNGYKWFEYLIHERLKKSRAICQTEGYDQKLMVTLVNAEDSFRNVSSSYSNLMVTCFQVQLGENCSSS